MIFAFEGVDGAGKTTAMKKVAEKLSHPTEIFKFPTYTQLGLYAKDSSKPYSGAMYFLLDIYEEMVHIQNSLDNNKIVLVDRFWPSTLVYAYARLMMQQNEPFKFQQSGPITNKVEYLFEWFDLTIEVLNLPSPYIVYLDLGGTQEDILSSEYLNQTDELDQNNDFQRHVHIGYQYLFSHFYSKGIQYNMANGQRRVSADFSSSTIANDINDQVNNGKNVFGEEDENETL